MSGLDRITRNAAVMGGKPCVRGMRVTVGTIVGLVASGHGFSEILTAYPYLEEEDIRQSQAMPRGALKKSKCRCRPHEIRHRHEPESALDLLPGGKGPYSGSLVNSGSTIGG